MIDTASRPATDDELRRLREVFLYGAPASMDTLHALACNHLPRVLARLDAAERDVNERVAEAQRLAFEWQEKALAWSTELGEMRAERGCHLCGKPGVPNGRGEWECSACGERWLGERPIDVLEADVAFWKELARQFEVNTDIWTKACREMEAERDRLVIDVEVLHDMLAEKSPPAGVLAVIQAAGTEALAETALDRDRLRNALDDARLSVGRVQRTHVIAQTPLWDALTQVQEDIVAFLKETS